MGCPQMNSWISFERGELGEIKTTLNGGAW